MADEFAHPQRRVTVLFAVGGIHRVQQVMMHEPRFASGTQAVVYERFGAVAVECCVEA